MTSGCTEETDLVLSHFLRYNGGFSLFDVVEGLLFSSHYQPPWKYLGELLSCDHLGVADVGKWRLGFWVLQGMG